MRISLVGLLVAAGALAGCNGENVTTGTPLSEGALARNEVTVNGQQHTLITALVGQEVGLHLGTLGPGTFDSLPVVSSPALRFLDAAIVGPYEPGGPQQLFRFMAVTPGRVILSFSHGPGFEGGSYQVVDTVDVR